MDDKPYSAQRPSSPKVRFTEGDGAPMRPEELPSPADAMTALALALLRAYGGKASGR